MVSLRSLRQAALELREVEQLLWKLAQEQLEGGGETPSLIASKPTLSKPVTGKIDKKCGGGVAGFWDSPTGEPMDITVIVNGGKDSSCVIESRAYHKGDNVDSKSPFAPKGGTGSASIRDVIRVEFYCQGNDSDGQCQGDWQIQNL